MNIIIFGPPGSGKGTQSRILSNKYDLDIIAAGDLLREMLTNSSSINIEVKNAIESGILVEDKFICDIIYNKLKLSVSNFILDGFPRNLIQAVFLNETLKEINQVIDYIIELQVSDDVVIERIMNRFMNKEIKQRCDDGDSNIIKKRIVEYKVQMEDLRKYYGNKILQVNAKVGMDQVTEAIDAFFS